MIVQIPTVLVIIMGWIATACPLNVGLQDWLAELEERTLRSRREGQY